MVQAAYLDGAMAQLATWIDTGSAGGWRSHCDAAGKAQRYLKSVKNKLPDAGWRADVDSILTDAEIALGHRHRLAHSLAVWGKSATDPTADAQWWHIDPKATDDSDLPDEGQLSDIHVECLSLVNRVIGLRNKLVVGLRSSSAPPSPP